MTRLPAAMAWRYFTSACSNRSLVFTTFLGRETTWICLDADQSGRSCTRMMLSAMVTCRLGRKAWSKVRSSSIDG